MSDVAARLNALGAARFGRGMALRVLSSLVLGVPAILCVFWGGWPFAVWVGLFGAVMAFEWNKIAHGPDTQPAFAIHLAGLAAVLVLSATGEQRLALAAIGLTAILGYVVVQRAGRDPRWVALGALYVLLPIEALMWLRMTAVEPAAVVLWLLAVVWATDTAALLVGRAVGGPRLAPDLSPSKTWAGLIGAIAGAALTGFAGGVVIGGAHPWLLALLAALLAVVGQLGDLTESAFKRRFGVKDSSGIIPGQGGVLDRVDGLIFATLTVAILALARGGDVLFLSVRS